MKKPWKITNFKVVVDVDGHPWLATNEEISEKYHRDHTEDLLKIVRTLSETLSKHYVNARLEAEQVCRFCGYNWESALDEDGNPICCNAAVEMSKEPK